MRAITAPKEILEIASNLKFKGQSIGLVPTMGALHEGHLALVKKSLEENDITIVSIFVNPLQFNNQEDLTNYPRSIDEDHALLKSMGVDFVFEPSEESLYLKKPMVKISFGHLENDLEGTYRPGHFAGVGIIVNKLLNITQPNRAYFGLKDLQQYAVITKMVEDLSIPVEIIGVETMREKSGLAMSSRNRRLSEKGLEIAANIHKGLIAGEKGILKHRKVNDLKSDLEDFYSSIEGLEVEYLEIIDLEDFISIDTYKSGQKLAVCFAGYVEGIRLIDNLIFAA